MGALVGADTMWSSQYCTGSFDSRKDGGSTILSDAYGKKWSSFYKFRSMCVDAEAKKENSWNKYHAGWNVLGGR